MFEIALHLVYGIFLGLLIAGVYKLVLGRTMLFFRETQLNLRLLIGHLVTLFFVSLVAILLIQAYWLLPWPVGPKRYSLVCVAGVFVAFATLRIAREASQRRR